MINTTETQSLLNDSITAMAHGDKKNASKGLEQAFNSLLSEENIFRYNEIDEVRDELNNLSSSNEKIWAEILGLWLKCFWVELDLSNELLVVDAFNSSIFIEVILDFIKSKIINLQSKYDINDIKQKDLMAGLLYNRAQCYLISADYHRSIKDYSESILLIPNQVASFAGRAVSYAMINRLSEAVEDGQTAHDNSNLPAISGTLDESYYARYRENRLSEFIRNLSIFRIKERDYKEALNLIDYSIKIQPYDADCYYYKARILFDLKNYDDSLKSIKTAIDKKPSQANYYFILAKVQTHQEAFSDSITSISTAIDLEPKEFRYHYTLANMYWLAKDYERARVAAGNLVKEFPSQSKGRRLLQDIEIFVKEIVSSDEIVSNFKGYSKKTIPEYIAEQEYWENRRKELDNRYQLISRNLTIFSVGFGSIFICMVAYGLISGWQMASMLSVGFAMSTPLYLSLHKAHRDAMTATAIREDVKSKKDLYIMFFVSHENTSEASINLDHLFSYYQSNSIAKLLLSKNSESSSIPQINLAKEGIRQLDDGKNKVKIEP